MLYFSLSLCIILCVLIHGVYSCYISGSDTGYCTTATLDYNYRLENMPFCWNLLQFPVCLPKPQYIPPMKEFPLGRWTNHTPLTKDMWIQDTFLSFVEERIKIETNRALARARVNEFGDKGRIKARFNNHKDCVNAFKNYFCWANFPRCDPTKDLSLPLCVSVCENNFKSCGHKRDLYRCGPMEYMNGYEPEQPSGTTSDGGYIYLRDYFPGGPFVKNKYKANNHERPICTPAILGSANNNMHSNPLVIFSSICLVIGLQYVLL